MVRLLKIIHLVPLFLHLTSATVTFTYLQAEELVENYLLLEDSNATIQVRNITSSDRSCFALFTNGHSLGNDTSTNGYKIPDEGIILSSRPPPFDFLEDSTQPSSGGAMAVDLCYIQFEFKCSSETSDMTPYDVNLDYVLGPADLSTYKEERIDDGSNNDSVFGIVVNGENIAVALGNGTASTQSLPGWNSIDLTVGAGDDASIDSWMLLAAGTLSCTEVVQEDVATIPTFAPAISPVQSPPDDIGTLEEGDDVPEERKFQIPLSLALGLLIILGLLALSMPIIGLLFYNKRITPV